VATRKLLLADDSITIQKVVNLTFADEGIEVITVGDGDSAMQKMTEVAPDLIMADVNMPGLNGYQICERIKQTESLKKTPVILLVGSFEPFDEEEAKRVGADDFLTKPFQSIRQLVTKVTDLLENSTRNGGVPSTDFENANTLSDFEVPQGNISPAYSSAQQPTEYGDTGMDDEMIQASSVSGYALDESAKFESKEVSEADEIGKTQPLSAEDLRQFSFTHPAEESSEASEETINQESVYQTSDEENLLEQTASQMEAQTEETTQSHMPPIFVSDDEDDLLEIPYDEEELEEEEPEMAATPEPQAYTQTEETAQAAPPESETTETVSLPEQSISEQSAVSEPTAQTESTITAGQSPVSEITAASQLTPEMIDAIAQKVVEKLSDRAVKDVAWEVVPQMADLIIKKMAEEKLKE
jgi:CheY-like chemotaxis protein